MKMDSDARRFERSDAAEIRAERKVASVGKMVGESSLTAGADHLRRDHKARSKDMKCGKM